jgi:hypothetical protein
MKRDYFKFLGELISIASGFVAFLNSFSRHSKSPETSGELAHIFPQTAAIDNRMISILALICLTVCFAIGFSRLIHYAHDKLGARGIITAQLIIATISAIQTVYFTAWFLAGLAEPLLFACKLIFFWGVGLCIEMALMKHSDLERQNCEKSEGQKTKTFPSIPVAGLNAVMFFVFAMLFVAESIGSDFSMTFYAIALISSGWFVGMALLGLEVGERISDIDRSSQ